MYESAGHRRDGGISREGSVALRRALIDLGVGLWHQDPTAKANAIALRERGKPGGIIATAMAHRANRIAYALVRDQTDPIRPAGADPDVFTTAAGRAALTARKAGLTPLRLWRARLGELRRV